jgi:protein-S-isoprenylcysteine O-methyltransferase Ste14
MNPQNYIFISVLMYAVLVPVIAAIAGTWQLPFFWIALALQLLIGVIGGKKLDPELIAERLKPKGKDQDPYAQLILGICFVLQFGLAALDVGRWHVADNIPMPLQIVALIPYALGWIGMMWSMQANKFFSSAIRLQPDRGQAVVSSGPYKYIRHPGYSFASLGFFFEGIALGSWLSVLAALPIIIDLAYRTVLEERLLTKDLPGYNEYTQSVRFRWLPGVW